ncbi:hypothetical protein [Streptomyces sp. NPDC003077]|uniref:hypothetical protein n=1 Tax=Streptomyces sp. NPDC003077 TaxID=3154443 RepID=UPI0033BE0333
MTDWTSTFVGSAEGHMHSGSGDQYNFQWVTGGRASGRTADPRAIPRDELVRLGQRFVEPTGMGEARERLRTTRTVVLVGDPGSGTRSTALMLLHELRHEPGDVHELPDRWDDEDKQGTIDSGDIAEHGRLLLDLTAYDEERLVRTQEEFSSLRVAVQTRSAHLVVLLPSGRDHLHRPELGHFTTKISRPDAFQVFRQHLRAMDIRPGEHDVLGPELTRFLAAEPMRRIAKLAERVRMIREEQGAATDFPHWLTEALASLTQRGAEISDRVAGLPSGSQRALLLASAMLCGARSDAVFHASASLLEATDHPPEDVPVLERADLVERFTEIGVRTDAADRVSFDGLGYDPAVRTHFWTAFPGLRPALRAWVANIMPLAMLDQEDRDRLADRFTELVLRTGPAEDLFWLVEEWTDPRTSYSRQAAAVLGAGVGHPHYGREFRRRIYDWSLRPDLTEQLTRVLVHICVDSLAAHYPDQAMVRLHHLARREHVFVARPALIGLARADRRIFERMLDRVTQGSSSRHRTADLDLFLELAEPTHLTRPEEASAPLLADEQVPRLLASGWHGVLTERPHDQWRDSVEAWLRACEESPHAAHLLDILVAAGAGNSGVLSRLYVIARDWAHADAGRRHVRLPVADGLWERIRSPQGLAASPFTA